VSGVRDDRLTFTRILWSDYERGVCDDYAGASEMSLTIGTVAPESTA
jgi:hypothetical protein